MNVTIKKVVVVPISPVSITFSQWLGKDETQVKKCRPLKTFSTQIQIAVLNYESEDINCKIQLLYIPLASLRPVNLLGCLGIIVIWQEDNNTVAQLSEILKNIYSKQKGLKSSNNASPKLLICCMNHQNNRIDLTPTMQNIDNSTIQYFPTPNLQVADNVISKWLIE